MEHAAADGRFRVTSRFPRRRIVAVALLVAGLALLVHGAWIPAKAALAQVLLHRAWERTRAGVAEARPWPWAATWPVARLEAPGHGVSQIVLADAVGATMAFAPGHLVGSAPPAGDGNTVLAAHRDTHFAFLRDVAVGDRFEVVAADGGRRGYRVTETRVVDHRDTSVLRASSDARLTLVTCYPFDAVVPGGPLRYVVVAAAVDR